MPAAFADQQDGAVALDDGVEAGGDDGGGLAFDDDRRARHAIAGAERRRVRRCRRSAASPLAGSKTAPVVAGALVARARGELMPGGGRPRRRVALTDQVTISISSPSSPSMARPKKRW